MPPNPKHLCSLKRRVAAPVALSFVLAVVSILSLLDLEVARPVDIINQPRLLRQPRYSRVHWLDPGMSADTKCTNQPKCCFASAGVLQTTGTFKRRLITAAISLTMIPSSATA